MSGTTDRAGPTRRERTHAATVAEISGIARRRMADEGATGLNLRAIAREMGMTPSALYRYFDGRDALLTALVVESYDNVGAMMEGAAAALDPAEEPVTAFMTLVGVFRDWAVAHPHEWALLFGSPVPGYEAPDDTVGHELRCSSVLLGLLSQAKSRGLISIAVADDDLPAGLHGAMAEVCRWNVGAPGSANFDELAPAEAALALACWSTMLGAVGAEVFGHLPPQAASAPREFFEFTMAGSLSRLGFDVEGWQRNQRLTP